jgi:hypothetical protein
VSWMSHSFHFDTDRVDRLNRAGVTSLRDLLKVLAALDLAAVIQLEELLKVHPPEEGGDDGRS